MQIFFDYLIKRPMLMCGIGCCLISFTAFYSQTAVLCLGLLLAVSLGFMIYFKTDARIIFTSVLIFVFCLSCIFTFNRIESLQEHCGTSQRAELTLRNITYKSNLYYLAEVQIEKSDSLPHGTKLTVFYEPADIKAGQRLIADIKLQKTDDGYYKRDGYSKEIFLEGNLSNIKVLAGKEDTLLSLADKTRSYIKNSLFDNMEYESAATLCALIFGNRDYFTEAFYDNVKSAGVSHVMVVSGMHMAILVSFFVMLLEKVFYNRFVKAFAVVTIVAVLTVLCGFTMSVLRAGVTYLIMAAGIMLDRKGTPENTLGGVVTLILIFSPFAIFSIALQLSLLSTFGILVVAIPVINRMECEKVLNRFSRAVITSGVFSLSAMLFTLPVTICVFGCISTVSIISNLLISAAVSAALYISVSALAVNLLLPFAAKYLFILAGLVTKYINYIINSVGELPFAVLEIPKFWGYIAIFPIFFLLILLLACKSKRDMLKLKEMNTKIIKEGGEKVRWHR